MRFAALLPLGSASCSLLFGAIAGEECGETPRCEGDEQILCEGGLEIRQTCPAGCDAENGVCPACGDALLSPGEECDDGNLIDGDGCSAACRLPRCNDGLYDPGEICFEAALDLELGPLPYALALADFDGDQDPDLLALRGEELLRFSNPGDGRLILSAVSPGRPGGAGRAARPASAADIDGDADLDLVLHHGEAPEPSLIALRNEGGGAFAPAPLAPLESPLHSQAVADLDGDALPEIAFVTELGPGETALHILKDPGGGFTALAAVPLGSPNRRLTLADLEGDGDLDLLLDGEAASLAPLDLIRQEGPLLLSAPLRLSGIPRPGQLSALGDLNGDLRLDLVVAGKWYAQAAGASFEEQLFTAAPLPPPPEPCPGLPVAPPPSPVERLGDIDGDETLDVILSSAEGSFLLFNRGGGRFSEPLLIEGAPAFSPGARLVDMDRDGRLDIVDISCRVQIFLSRP